MIIIFNKTWIIFFVYFVVTKLPETLSNVYLNVTISILSEICCFGVYGMFINGTVGLKETNTFVLLIVTLVYTELNTFWTRLPGTALMFEPREPLEPGRAAVVWYAQRFAGVKKKYCACDATWQDSTPI